jgi:hypothetical protein
MSPGARLPVASPRPVRREAPVGAMLSALAVALLVVLGIAPPASATYAAIVSPPFEGVQAVLATTISTSGCHARGEFALSPRENVTTGTARVSERAFTRYWSAATSDFQFANVVSTTGFYGPNFTVPATGTYTAMYDWELSYRAALNASGPTDATSATVSIFALGYLYDSTNDTVLSGDGGDVFALFHELYDGAWSTHAHDVELALENQFTLVTGHVYYFETVLLADARTVADGAGTAGARLNLGTDGDRARLVELTLVSE